MAGEARPWSDICTGFGFTLPPGIMHHHRQAEGVWAGRVILVTLPAAFPSRQTFFAFC
jgi:hypothetical protein